VPGELQCGGHTHRSRADDHYRIKMLFSPEFRGSAKSIMGVVKIQ
jgi:hypothetical protein